VTIKNIPYITIDLLYQRNNWANAQNSLPKLSNKTPLKYSNNKIIQIPRHTNQTIKNYSPIVIINLNCNKYLKLCYDSSTHVLPHQHLIIFLCSSLLLASLSGVTSKKDARRVTHKLNDITEKNHIKKYEKKGKKKRRQVRDYFISVRCYIWCLLNICSIWTYE